MFQIEDDDGGWGFMVVIFSGWTTTLGFWKYLVSSFSLLVLTGAALVDDGKQKVSVSFMLLLMICLGQLCIFHALAALTLSLCVCYF